MKQLTVLQRMSRQVNPHDEKYIDGARPGMLLIGDKDLRTSVHFMPFYSGIRWFGDFIGRSILYIERRSDEFFILQRPFTAELTGELLAGKSYLLTSEECRHMDQSFYCIKAKEEC